MQVKSSPSDSGLCLDYGASENYPNFLHAPEMSGSGRRRAQRLDSVTPKRVNPSRLARSVFNHIDVFAEFLVLVGGREALQQFGRAQGGTFIHSHPLWR
jgi:hypothetical protein